MTRSLAAAFGLGMTVPLLLALYLGGEVIAQAGLRLVAIEQGFALAGRHWTFDAVPEHHVETVAMVEEPKTKARKR